jgi:hypothetical protein
MGTKGDRAWPLAVQKIELDENWNPEDEPKKCARCSSEDLVQETSGPLTNWITCHECGLWHPQLA